MRKHIKRQCQELLDSIEEAGVQIRDQIERRQPGVAAELLETCQQAAIQAGSTIESHYGEGTEAVHALEEYCETAYLIHEELLSGTVLNARQIEKKLRKPIRRARIELLNNIPTRIEAVFLPYKVSMWDSMESIWRAAAADPDCEAVVIPIPYFDRTPDGGVGEIHYEGDRYPDEIPIVRYDEYSLEEHRPDMVFIHNPYDKYNFLTTVHPLYYSENLKKFTDCLVYVPYFVTNGGMAAAQALLPAYLHADYIVVQSESIIRYFDARIPREKFLPFGSPKFDKIIQSCSNPPVPYKEWEEEMRGRKVFFYNTSVTGLLENTSEFLEKMDYVFETFKRHPEACLLWRPHPLIEHTIETLRPEKREAFEGLKRKFLEEHIGIYDTTPQIEDTIALSDAYIGDLGTSVTSLFGVAGKPIFVLNNRIHSAPAEGDWKSAVFVPPEVKKNDRYCILMRNQLFKRDDSYHYSHYCDLSEYGCGTDYLNVFELSGKVYVFPCGAEHILVVNPDRTIRKIELRHENTRPNAFYGASYLYGDETFAFLFPDHYPYFVRFNTKTEQIDYIEGVSGYNFAETKDGERVRAASGLFHVNRCAEFLNPEGTEMLSVNVDTLEIKKRKMHVDRLATGIYCDHVNTDTWYFLPYEGTDLVKWSIPENRFEVISAGIEGLLSLQRPRRFQCDKKYFWSCAFTGHSLILSPNWGNKFVEIDLETNELSEWTPPFAFSNENKNGYWPNTGIGWFVPEIESWMEGRIDQHVRFYYSPEHRVFEIDLETRECNEVLITADREEILSLAVGFGRISRWMPYCCEEGLFHSLDDIITGNIHGEPFDRERQLKAFSDINASLEGTCGQQVYSGLKKRLSDQQ